MSIEEQKPVVVGESSAPVAPVPFVDVQTTEPVGADAVTEQPAVEDEVAAPVEEVKVAEPIYSGTLGYKAPGLKNAFRFAKKHFWFGEEPVPTSSLTQYLRGEKPEIGHSVAAWSSQTGKGLLFFVKHADKKDAPDGVLNLAYATDLVKDGALAFALKVSGHKHTFEASTAAERDGWFIAAEKVIAEAKEAKESIESSESYKEQKEKLGKPTTLAAATTPAKSIDATPKAVEGEAVADAPAPVRAGSSSSSSSDEEKKQKKKATKSRSRSNKRASIFGGFRGKKEKTEEKAELKKDGSEATAVPELTKEEPLAVPHVGDVHPSELPQTTAAPDVAQDLPTENEEAKVDTSAPIVPSEELSATPGPLDTSAADKPKIQKRGSMFGTLMGKLKSPTTEKRENDVFPAVPAKDTEALPEIQQPTEEPLAAVPVTETSGSLKEASLEAPKTEETKPAQAVTPSKEKEHFSFGKLFGGKDKAKSPAPETAHKVQESAPQIEDTTVPATSEPVPAVVETPKVESAEHKEETPVAKKRSSIFGSLIRSASKAGGKKDTKEKKENVAPATVAETAEPTDAALVSDVKDDVAAPATIGDVVPEAVTVDQSSKTSAPVASTA
ncbi:hypothetical protein P153DRAFT_383638 [Dothidotthia symphoricarpi CBS 119687]|uniref:Meiotic expression up-regulated protein 6 PH domain-containing protein n=1 Tax=Dothidotthia symphoricarpi CBS 119687 TaxID=1392245 RepID=A0A6A6AKU7_9PLEO|nr:uncharacterized protein P153DRAFT_383638 [Dothidotthia symphoricarpi CBS 119687]KAF2131544.1 hypothetical protein P153DRAFT_383638 [Dothidotthia symphoricarpi CBS 119687]